MRASTENDESVSAGCAGASISGTAHSGRNGKESKRVWEDAKDNDIDGHLEAYEQAARIEKA